MSGFPTCTNRRRSTRQCHRLAGRDVAAQKYARYCGCSCSGCHLDRSGRRPRSHAATSMEVMSQPSVRNVREAASVPARRRHRSQRSRLWLRTEFRRPRRRAGGDPVALCLRGDRAPGSVRRAPPGRSLRISFARPRPCPVRHGPLTVRRHGGLPHHKVWRRVRSGRRGCVLHGSVRRQCDSVVINDSAGALVPGTAEGWSLRGGLLCLSGDVRSRAEPGLEPIPCAGR